MKTTSHTRSHLLDSLRNSTPWDLIVIGGGATGLGAAVDAASRGYRTLLLEGEDFAKGTSSRATKLVHGGVRYLAQGNISLVRDALRERGLLLQNAPHLAHGLGFVIPAYKWWSKPFYGIGLTVYDLLAGNLGLGRTRWLNREQTLKHTPSLRRQGLRGGILYYDGQFDDARLAITLMQTAFDEGALLINHMRVTGLQKTFGCVSGVIARDSETGEAFRPHARAVINATGVFVDDIRRMDDPSAANMLSPSQGIHLVVDRRFQPGDSAIMIPKTDDGRVLFAVPWHDKVVIGTTDTPVDHTSLEPRALEEEIEFVLRNAGRYLAVPPTRADVLSIFAGQRPLVKAVNADGSTAALSRDHVIRIATSGLITITGGKWTTYRKMGEEVVDHAVPVGGLEKKSARTALLKLHGWTTKPDGELSVYGTEAEAIRQLPGGNLRLHPDLAIVEAQVRWAARHELARTVEDVLARRTRALLLNARASLEAAPRVATILAEELGHDLEWAGAQVREYETLASGYLLTAPPTRAAAKQLQRESALSQP
ncbi:MAG TPA: glycerol-3-phosphate dehydrogenase/oxidase [Chthoniobacterales bacterium]